MKLNEEEMYNAYPWLLTYQGWAFLLSSLSLFIRVPQALGIVSPSLGHCVPNIVGQDKIIG